jgi:hypothetical protein
MTIKIICSFGERANDVERYLLALRRCDNNNYLFKGLNHRKYLGISKAWSPYELDYLYRNNDKNLINFYSTVEKVCETADIFIVNHENVYHPEFIKKLSKSLYTILYTSDDPESSYFSTVPYVWSFDHVLCYSIYYDKETLMIDKLKQWGAKRANYKPHGYYYEKHNSKLTVNELFSKNRDIDVLYVGGPYNKVRDLLKIKKTFGKRFKLYGNWGGIGPTLGLYRRYGFFKPIKHLSEEDFVNTYTNAKIGINMHMSYGPSNLRMWDLPINGVMQVTDNPVGTSKIFEIGKEICCYENGNVEQAIDIIDYYLINDIERKEIAQQGYFKVKSKYSFEQTYWDIMPYIMQGIENKSHDSES